MTTKERIIYEALELFSVHGYQDVSTRDIAKAMAMSDAVIYKHFKNKKDIFDSIIGICKEKFMEQLKTVEYENMDWDHLEDICLSMFRFQRGNEWIVRFRRILVMEQFRNPEMYQLYRELFIDMEVKNTARLLTVIQEQGYIREDVNPFVVSMEIYAPFFMYHMMEEENEEIYSALREHIAFIRREIKK